MQIILNENEIKEIIKSHLLTLGFESQGMESCFSSKTDYLYHGDPTREERTSYEKQVFDGIKVNVKKLG